MQFGWGHQAPVGSNIIGRSHLVPVGSILLGIIDGKVIFQQWRLLFTNAASQSLAMLLTNAAAQSLTHW
jgi:hypothetical protein